jgi:hypothetical protein
VVGRELHTICPSGEDHQGHAWGGIAGDGRRRGGLKSLIVKMKMMGRVLIWGLVFSKKDSLVMSFGLLVLI